MDIDEIRRVNIRALEIEHGPELAKKAGMSPAQFYNLRDGAKDSRTGKPRGMRKETAWRIEDAAGVPRGYLDVLHLADKHQANTATTQKGRDVPLISWVAAGNWSAVADPYLAGDADDWLACPVKHGDRTFALKVRGSSMYDPRDPRSFADGDVIFVDPDKEAAHRSLVVVRMVNEDEATFKRLLIEGDTKMLEAINPDWPNRIMPVNGKATICGVVIGVFRGV